MTLDDAVKVFEGDRRVVDGHPTTMSQTGDEYVTICSSGLKQAVGGCDGGVTDEFAHISEEDAIQAWLISVQAYYAADKRGTIYWRIRPEVGNKKSLWSVYSRFVISGKPEISFEERLKIAVSNRIARNRELLRDCNVLVRWRADGHYFAAREADGVVYSYKGNVLPVQPTEVYHKTLDEILEHYEIDQALAG